MYEPNADPLNATLIEREDVHADLAILRVLPDQPPAPPFQPGQFINLALPRTDPAPAVAPTAPRRGPRLVRRAFSIASPAWQRGHLEFCVVLVEAGRLTPRLWDIQAGGRLWMDNKASGRFTLDGVPADRDLVMVATGTGLAPYMAMLRTYAGRQRWRHFVLIHGVRQAADLAYRAELEELAARDPTVHYLPTVSRDPQDPTWSGPRGRVQALLAEDTYRALVGQRLDPDRCHLFLCGNPAMVEDVIALLRPRGFRSPTETDAGNLHVERYW